MKLRDKVALGLAVLLGAFLLGYFHKPPSGPKVVTPLAQNETGHIVVDPGSHSVSIQTSKGIKREFLPDRPTTFDVDKQGNVRVSSPQFGFEHPAFIGGLISDKARIGLGMDGLYFKRLDLGIGIAGDRTVKDTIVFGKLSYNFYSNLQAGIVYGSNKYVGASLTLRI